MFAHTSASALLVAPEFSKTTDLLLHQTDEAFKSAGYFPEALELYASKNDPAQKSELRTAFNLAFNTQQHFFDYIYEPENIERFGRRFGRAMAGVAGKFPAETLSLYDWTRFKKGDKIVDIDGGVDHIGVAIAKLVEPGVEVIVQDLPSVVE
jgi:hypothetical protein